MAPAPEPPDLPPLVSGGSLDADVALAAGVMAAGAAGPRAHHGPVHTHCENCGTKLEGPFCHRCGQHDFEFHRSFGHVLLEALESFFHFEGKFFRNIVTLLFRPGRLTAEFNAGKRAAQMPPFRLYVFVSLAFFFVFFLRGGETGAPMEAARDEAPDPVESTLTEAVESLGSRKAAAAAVPPAGDAQPPPSAAGAAAAKSVVILSDAGEPVRIEGAAESPFLGWLERTLNRLNDPAYRARLVDTFVHSVPRLLLFCLPLFALYTRLLFRRSGLVYLQHLVLALHFHAFVYLWILFRDGWAFLAGFASPVLASLVWQACMLWAAVYPVLMFRTLFGNGWVRTAGKTLALGAAYVVTLGVGFLTALVLVLLAV